MKTQVDNEYMGLAFIVFGILIIFVIKDFNKKGDDFKDNHSVFSALSGGVFCIILGIIVLLKNC